MAHPGDFRHKVLPMGGELVNNFSKLSNSPWDLPLPPSPALGVNIDRYITPIVEEVSLCHFLIRNPERLLFNIIPTVKVIQRRDLIRTNIFLHEELTTQNQKDFLP